MSTLNDLNDTSFKDVKSMISHEVVLKGKRKEILDIIKENKNSEIFFLKVKASIALFVYLLNNSKIKKLIVLPSIYGLLNRKVLDALKKSGVEIEVRKRNVGRPRINEEKILKVLRKKGRDKDKIKELRISRRVFYYYKKKLKNKL